MAQLDRVIRVFVITPGGIDDGGNQLPDTYVTHRVWSNTRAAGESQSIDARTGFVDTTEYKSFIVRWREEYYTAPSGTLYVADDYNRLYAITSVDELESVAQRRRFAVLSGLVQQRTPAVSPPFPNIVLVR